ncbi:MAG: metallophosphatase [Chitinophagaceae bacterium]|jgi:5'-nucleotidase|nr:metallophosphatase [Chitinophagaceae bacterium]
MSNRRTFIRQTGLAAASFLTAHPLLYAGSIESPHTTRLTILHTNDVHSRLEPFPMDGGSNAGRGGVAARAALIRKIRATEEHVLLLDAGDIFQGTPYFNIFKGEPELRAMQMMGYDAAVMGNHDFDAGIENFADQLSRHARFPIVMCNYDFRSTPMENRHVPHMVVRKGPLRIGITGVGIELQGLVPENLYGKTVYLDPVKAASEQADYLKTRKKCDMVICISHLGDKYDDNKVSDAVLARESENIDLILGGHTHRFFDAPRVYRNKAGEEVIVNQVGWAGLRLGRLDYAFSGAKSKILEKNQSLPIGKKEAE